MSQLYSTGALHNMVRYDARQHIRDCIGDLSSLGPHAILGNQLLLAPYVHSGLTWNERHCHFGRTDVLTPTQLEELYEVPGIFLNQQLAKEDLFQSKVYLVLKIGTEPTKLEIKEGDWVWTLQENTRQVSISLPSSKKSFVLDKIGAQIASGWICKICYDSDIYGVLPDHDSLV
jgi:hypothetical protein